ncbi:MAG: site-specific integrase, partial [Prochlorothrix sp.]
KINLRATFPPKPGSQRLRPHQQRLSLKIPATLDGVKAAEREAKIIAAQLLAKTFDWHPYLVWSLETRQGTGGIGQQIQDFEQYFWEQGDRSANLAASRTTWEGAYLPYLRRLQTISQTQTQLTASEAIYAAIESYQVNSRSRQLCCTALGAFADFLKLELPLDLQALKGSYNPSKTRARTLPSDAEILERFSQIPNPQWQFVYGIMATYGLRNHEVFFCDYQALTQGEALPTLRVLETTKTGEHEVWPFLPDWIDRFNLRQVQLPSVNTDLTETTLQNIGQRVTRQFRRYGLPFSPYDLRHAWAVRTINLGLPDTVAAKMMGHSVAIHTRTYHRWITRRDQQQAVNAALGRQT